MAGDWIPMRMDLLDDPAVIAIAAAVGLDEYAVAGRLLKLWGWANRHLKDGHAFVPDKWVDDYLGTAGFAAAMLDAGWLRTRSAGGLEFTSFDRWNSSGAKVRLGETLRKRAFREKKLRPESVPKVSRTKQPVCPGPEKRREEKRREKTPQPPRAGAEDVPIPAEIDTPEFRAAWADWLADRKARGKKVTERAADGQLADLAKLGPRSAAECVRESIKNGWTGIFPERFGPPAPRAGPPAKQTTADVIAALGVKIVPAAPPPPPPPPRGKPDGSA